MTQQEAEEAIGASGFSVSMRKTNEAGEPVLYLSVFKMAGVPLVPILRFAPSLTSVALYCPDSIATISAYEMLKRNLTDAYGIPPTSRNFESASGGELVGFKGPYFRNDTWSFPKTTVDLMFAGSADMPGNTLMVVFRDPQSLPGTSFIPEAR